MTIETIFKLKKKVRFIILAGENSDLKTMIMKMSAIVEGLYLKDDEKNAILKEDLE